MKSNELMCGNWVFDIIQKRNVKVWGIESNHDDIFVNYANGYGVYSGNILCFNHIPLTEEILLKCGFEKEGYGFNLKVKNEFLLSIEKHDEWVVFFKVSEEYSFTALTYIEYIHQLQNLYFALTQKELEINL